MIGLAFVKNKRTDRAVRTVVDRILLLQQCVARFKSTRRRAGSGYLYCSYDVCCCIDYCVFVDVFSDMSTQHNQCPC